MTNAKILGALTHTHTQAILEAIIITCSLGFGAKNNIKITIDLKRGK